MNRGAWRATVHRVLKTWTRLKGLSMHACMCVYTLIYVHIHISSVHIHIHVCVYTYSMCICMCVYVYIYVCMLGSFNHVRLFATLWAPLSMGFYGHWRRCHTFLQGIFLTQGSNQCLLHYRQILYRLNHHRSPPD